MGDYYLDRCPQEAMNNIADLCRSHNMEECECRPPTRQWLSGKEVSLVRYSPEREGIPLVVQTWPQFDHTNPLVRDFLRKVVDITGANIIDKYHKVATKFDMAVLE